MKRSIVFLLISAAVLSGGEKMPVQYEELSAPRFSAALDSAGGTVIIPLGILEKHGPHMPFGTDLLDARETVLRAVAREYSIVFPPYYFGQIYEARHQPGTIAYSPELVWKLLQETCDELGRNGFTKIILVNGHGGNNSLLPYFCQSQLAARKPYAVILFQPEADPEVRKKVASLRKTQGGGHADEEEASMLQAHRPDLVHTERADTQSGADQDRLPGLSHAYTGIWWYARFPNHYAGDGSHASAEIGNLILDSEAAQLAELIAQLKADDRINALQQRFYDEADNPAATKQ